MIFPSCLRCLLLSALCFAVTVPLAADSYWSDASRLPAPPQAALGYPSHAVDVDVWPGFLSPPAGYGQVPFWWWTGDPLDKERLTWQIEELHKKGIAGMQVNYSHEDTPGMPTSPMEPSVFSEAWWEIWQWVVGECRKRDMGIGISGYTMDWPGKAENLFGQILYSDPEYNGRELAVSQKTTVDTGNTIQLEIPEGFAIARAYRLRDGIPQSGGLDLMNSIHQGHLRWTPQEGQWQIWLFSAPRKPITFNPLHPKAGGRVIEKFFQPCEDHAPEGTSAGLNYFFQDELMFGVNGILWTDDFLQQFSLRKGYDLQEVLPALFADIGPITPKVRLDYQDVKMQLQEERYFKPIFDWHWSRGLIYGCDPGSRGLNPSEFGDYFRAVRWYTAPGHDTPGGKADLIKGKVSSSISHLYHRPRVWLEGYHSLGWGAKPETLMHATCENYLYGCTLLNLHGLYYTTHGSFWEWAPPCYHFRMPYWDHLPVFLQYFDRLSYLLSQGSHVCDVAILYPVAPYDAGMGGEESTNTAFTTGRQLMAAGIDFDFIDFQSLDRAKVENGKLHVSGEAYQVLILPSMKAIRWSSIQKAVGFAEGGGVVLTVGALPEASDRAGREDAQLDTLVRRLAGVSAREAQSGQAPSSQSFAPGQSLWIAKPEQVPAAIAQAIPLDVRFESNGKALHRKAGSRDIYMVMDVNKGEWCEFRAKGQVELWDPWTGTATPLPVVTETENGTRVRMPLHANEAQLIVFSPGQPTWTIQATDLDEITSLDAQNSRVNVTGYASQPGLKQAQIHQGTQQIVVSGTAQPPLPPLVLDGTWEMELLPTMDNRWGDFRLPVTEQIIGPEARRFRYKEEDGPQSAWQNPTLDDSAWQSVLHGFGQKFWLLGPLPKGIDFAALDEKLATLHCIDPAQPISIDGKNYMWKPYAFSWRWGKEGDPGHQGWHGLKEKVTDHFLCLGQPKGGFNETLYVEEEEGTHYYLWTTARAQAEGPAQVEVGGITPASVHLNGVPVDPTQPVPLRAGANPLLLRYDQPGRGHFVLVQPGSPAPAQKTPLAMRWLDTPGLVPYDVHPNKIKTAGWYRFTAPPGLQAMAFSAFGDVQAWVDGQAVSCKPDTEEADGLRQYTISLPTHRKRQATVALRIEQTRGYYGGSTIPNPIRLQCGVGETTTGDWAVGSVLQNYSGGAWYRKTFSLNKEQTRGRVVINLGEVVATAAIHINGAHAGTLVAPPWKWDITQHVQVGENQLQILVYNTLANHYSTIPTRYGGDLKSGLLGPVQVEMQSPVILTETQ